MKKSFLSLLFVFSFCLCGFSSAEKIESTVYDEAVVAIGELQTVCTEVKTKFNDADTTFIIENVCNTLDVASTTLMIALEDLQDGSKTNEWSQLPEGICISGLQYIPALNVNCEAEVQNDESCLVIKLSMYQPNGTLMGIQRVELGIREEEFMALLVDYDNITGLTGRYAMYPQENDPRIIFTKTIGKTLNICLDVRAWAEGANYSEWSKTLLLPDAVLYQTD